MAADLVPVEGDTIPEANDVGLTPRQISALEKLTLLGAAPRNNTEEKYNSDPQIRALQMVFEGRFGGAGRGQGRPSREVRISVALNEFVRTKLSKKVQTALDRALNPDAGERINLDAIKLIVEMEHKEAKLQLDEDRADVDNQSKEELLATLFELVSDVQTGQIIDATFADIPAPTQESFAQVAERAARKESARQRKKTGNRTSAARGKSHSSSAGGSQRNGDSSGSSANGVDTASSGGNGRRQPKGDRSTHPNPVTQAALRRAANRR